MIVWKFKKDATPQGSSDGFWYDLTAGGKIKLEKLLADEQQLKIAKDAIRIAASLEEALEEAELLNEF